MVGAVVAAACGSGRSALQAGLDEPDTVASTAPSTNTVGGSTGDTPRPAQARPARPRPTRPDRRRPRRSRRPRPSRRSPTSPTARPVRSTRRAARSRSRSGTAWRTNIEASLVALTNEYNASQDRGARRSPEPDELRLGHRQVHPVEPGQPPDPGRSSPSTSSRRSPNRARSIPIEACLEDERLRHVRVPRTHARRLHVRGHPAGRCRST